MNQQAILLGVLVVAVVLELVGLLILIWIIKNKPQRGKMLILGPPISHYTPPRKPSIGKSKIPKKIFQTFSRNRMEIGTYNATKTWIKNNPEYSYHFFNNEEIRKYIKNNFEKRVLKAFDSLIPGAYKADLWRYCILYKEGGVYADAKQVNLVPLKKIIDPKMDFISVKDRPKNAIYNAFICTVPRHPFMKKAIDLSVDNILNRRYNTSNLDITGPETLGKAVLSLTKSEKDLEAGIFDSEYGKYELLDAKLDDHIILKDGIPAIQSRHVGFTNWSKISGVPHYEVLWHHRGVYKNDDTENPMLFPSTLDTTRPSFSFSDPIS